MEDKKIDPFWDCFCNNELVCPYCGYEHSDSWEYDSDSGEAECDKCGKEFDYCRNVSVDYTTSRKEDRRTF